MPIRFYDHNEVTYSPHFVAQDSNKEKIHNGHSYQKIGVVKEARSFMWSIGQIFKGFSFGVMGVVALPLSLCCRRSTSRSCFKSFVSSLHQAWRKEETVKVYILKQQPFFQAPSTFQPSENPLPEQQPKPQQNPTLIPQDPIPEIPRPIQPSQDLLFASDEQSIESVMEMLKKRFEQAEELHENEEYHELESLMKETFELVYAWCNRDPTQFERPLALARVLCEFADSEWINSRMACELYLRIIANNPENKAIINECISYAIEVGEMRICAPLIEKTLEDEPDNIEMRINYAHFLFDEYSTVRALQQYKKVLESNPHQVDALLGLAKCLRGRNEEDQVQRLLENAIEIAPENSIARYEYGKVLREKGLVDEGCAQWKKALELDPCSMQIRYDYMNALLDQNLDEEAIRICEEGFDQPINFSNIDEIYCRTLLERSYCRLLLDLQETEKLSNYCQQRLENQPRDTIEVRKLYIQLLKEQGNDEGVLQQLSAILEENPYDIETLTSYFTLLGVLRGVEEMESDHRIQIRDENPLMGLAYARSLRVLGQLDKAEVEFYRLLQQPVLFDPQSSIEKDYLDVLELLGKKQVISGYIESAIIKNSRDFKWIDLYADYLEKWQQVDRAIALVSDFLDKDPGSTKARKKWIQLLQKSENSGELKKFYRRELERNPADVATRRQYGDFLKASNNFEGAAEQYGLALELDFSEYQFRIFADVLRQAGKAEEIPLFYERALEKSPNNAHLRHCYVKHLVNAHKLQEAAEQYEELLKSVDGERQTMIRQEFAKVLNELERKAEAVDQYRQVLDTDPTNFYATRQYFQLLTDLNCSEEIEPCYRLLIESGHNRLIEEYALWLKKQNRTAEAAEQFRLYLKTEPYYFDSKPYVEVLAILNLHDEGEQYFKQRIQKAEHSLDARLDYIFYLEERNKLDDAVQECLELLALYPNEVNAWERLGRLFKSLGRIKELEESYLAAIEDKPDNVAPRLSYVQFLVGENKYAEALQQYHDILAVEPGNMSARCAYIDLLIDEKHLNEAIKVGQDGLRGKDLNDEDWDLRGLRAAYAGALVQGGLKNEAAEQYRILIDQGCTYYQGNLDRLED